MLEHDEKLSILHVFLATFGILAIYT